MSLAAARHGLASDATWLATYYFYIDLLTSVNTMPDIFFHREGGAFQRCHIVALNTNNVSRFLDSLTDGKQLLFKKHKRSNCLKFCKGDLKLQKFPVWAQLSKGAFWLDAINEAEGFDGINREQPIEITCHK